MVGFEYHNQSTENIIDTPLILVNYDGLNGLGSSRSKIEGNRTISRFITNEYGTMYEPLSFTYSLIKSDYEPFTELEQVTVERWLTSPKLSSELKITNCDEYQYSYFGLFTETHWEMGNGDLFLLTFTFQVNGAYAYKYFETEWKSENYNEQFDFTINNNNITISNHAMDITNTESLTIDGTSLRFVNDTDATINRIIPKGTIDVYCYTDELEEYVYPIITAHRTEMGSNSSFSIIQRTDNAREMKITTSSMFDIVVDSRHCRAYTVTATGQQVQQLKFRELNWNNTDYVYWPRLIPGNNQITIEGEVNVTIGYYAPYKKIGGWLV